MIPAGLAVLAALALIASIPPAKRAAVHNGSSACPNSSSWLPRLIFAGAATRVMVGLPGPGAARHHPHDVLLVGLTLVLSWLARARMFREASALVYPLLVATGLKLVFDDVLHADPAALFIAFSAYGAALIAGPRL